MVGWTLMKVSKGVSWVVWVVWTGGEWTIFMSDWG